MQSPSSDSSTTMVNVLEELVLKEAKMQLRALPENQQKNLLLPEVAAYVLNRVQPMYATNKDGWGRQRERALRSVGPEIEKQVRAAIVKIRNSPARMTKPLPETVEARCSLNQLRVILKHPDLTWMELPQVIEELVARASQTV